VGRGAPGGRAGELRVERLYDRIGRGYPRTRRPDPRIQAAIHGALGDATSVVNVGAGTGNYEPRDRTVVAVEPSEEMIGQRPPGAARVVRARAEELPFADGEFDAAMAVLSDHHWADRPRGLREMRRVASRRAVVFTFDPDHVDDSWLLRDYLPGFRHLPGMAIDEIAAHLGAADVRTVPIPADCRDGFLHAYWARPQAYLDPEVRRNISVFARLSAAEVEDTVERLRVDLASGAWEDRNRDILDLAEMDLGYRLVVAEYG
jgi:SAM-dependent methyltransferase